jgi:CPA2 family monovalent cation:H+ antiporter-2
MVAKAARRLAREVEAVEAHGSALDLYGPVSVSDHVVVAGYGGVGLMLGAVLDDQGLPHVGIDLDPDLVASFRHKGGGVFFGDARRADLLRNLGTDRAIALVVTMDSPLAAEQVVEVVAGHWPGLTIYARARDAAHAARLRARGATHVIPETIEASLQLSEMVLVGASVPVDAARHLIEVRRQAEQARIDEAR